MKRLLLILAVALTTHAQTNSNAKKLYGYPIPQPGVGNDTQTLTFDFTNKRWNFNTAGGLPNSVLCTGVDDTAALTAAATTAGTWYFPMFGNCVTDGVTFTSSNITWIGNGTTIKHKSTGAANYLLTDNGHNNIDISGFVLDDNGVLQTTTNLYMTVFVSGGPNSIHNTIYRNSGTIKPTMGGAFFYQETYDFFSNSIENTIRSTQIYNDSGALAVKVHIEKNILDGSNTNAIFTQYNYVTGAQETISRNHITNIGTDAVDGQCDTNTGQCGNGILVTHTYNADVADNVISSPAFSCVRVSYSAHVNVHGGHCDSAGEVSFWSEFPSGTGAAGNIFSNLIVTNSFDGISNANIGAVGTSDPDIITGNKFFNISDYAIHAENAILTNNEVTGAAKCYEVGYGGTGYGNMLGTNSCTHAGATVTISQGLTATPNNQVGLLNVQNPINAAFPNIIPVNGPGVISVTNAVNNAGTLQLTLVSAATSGATYLLRGFVGQPGANGASCLASATATTINCTGLATPSGTWAAGVSSTNLELIYSSGTTLAYSLPATLTLFTSLQIGAAIASAATIAPTAPITHITGTTSITTITAPSAFTQTASGGCLILIPNGLWSTGTSGNIAIATTGVVSKALTECYDPATSKWYPSY